MAKLAIIGVVVIIIVAILIYLQYGVPWEPITESEARDIIKDQYPDAGDDFEITQEQNCEVCDEFGCYIIETCWVANISDGTGQGVMVPGSAPGGAAGIGGGGPGDDDEPCVGWWCNAPSCTYFYQETTQNGTIDHYNTGCSDPVPACDETYDKCKECENSLGCLITTITDTGNKSYYYEVVGADAWGSINETDMFCLIFDDGKQVFGNQSTIEFCEEMFFDWINCYNTYCDYEPTFGFIPI